MLTADLWDYAWQHPNFGAVPGAPPDVSRYISFDDSKDLTAAEATEAHRRGQAIQVNFEADDGACLRGYGEGLNHGRQAARKKRSVGAPMQLVVVYSCDVDVQPSQYQTVGQYLRGATEGEGNRSVGVYGHASLLDWLKANCPWVTVFWQTVAWSNGKLSPHAALYQYHLGVDVAGGNVDFNHIIDRSALSLWNADGTVGGRAVDKEEITMADAQRIIDEVDRGAVGMTRRILQAVTDIKGYVKVEIDSLAVGTTRLVNALSARTDARFDELSKRIDALPAVSVGGSSGSNGTSAGAGGGSTLPTSGPSEDEVRAIVVDELQKMHLSGTVSGVLSP